MGQKLTKTNASLFCDRFISFSLYVAGFVGFVVSLKKKHYLKLFTLVCIVCKTRLGSPYNLKKSELRVYLRT
jgi:hypothetical protein